MDVDGTSASKRSRICVKQTAGSSIKSKSDCQPTNNTNKTIYCKILCQKDYLSIICYYLTIYDIFHLFPTLSTYHFDYLNDQSQLNMIKQCLFYDFGDILNLFKINLQNNENDNDENNNICIKIGRFYNDWDYLMNCAKNAGIEADPDDIDKNIDLDFSPLMKLEKSNCVHYWINKVN